MYRCITLFGVLFISWLSAGDLLIVTSESFKNGEPIPKQYTCHGENISPQLQWNTIEHASSYVVIVEDPDAPGGTWTHWIAFDIAPETTILPAAVSIADMAAKNGINAKGGKGYSGPCPPPGIHRYYFNVYALDTVLGLPDGSSKIDIQKAMQGHIMTKGALMGLYEG